MTRTSALRSALGTHGFAHAKTMVAPDLLTALRAAFDAEVRPYAEPLRRQHNARWECHELSEHGWIVNPLLNPHALPQFPALTDACNQLIEASSLLAHAGAILGAPAALHQTAYYDSGLGSTPHRDDHPARAAGAMVAVLVALEPMTEEGGAFVLWPSTHTIDDPTLDELGRLAWERRHLERADAQPQADALGLHLQALLSTRQPLLATIPAGDAVWWDRRTIHGSLAPTLGSGKSRASFIAHFIRE